MSMTSANPASAGPRRAVAGFERQHLGEGERLDPAVAGAAANSAARCRWSAAAVGSVASDESPSA